MIIVDYEKDTGMINRVIRYPRPDYDELYPGCLYFGDTFQVSDATHYVKDGSVEIRPSMHVVIEGSILKGVPAGSSVIIEGSEYTADGSDIELDFEFSGKYLIQVTQWPFIDAEVMYETFP